jgi:glutathione S-transferase
MEPILLYGFPAGSSMGLVAAFERVARPYRLCRVDMLSQMKTEAFGGLNGRQETPVLITEGGRVVTETMAIAAWLEARDTERRVSFEPQSPEADRMHQLMAFVNTGFTAAFGPFLQALRDFGREAVLRRHGMLEAMIGETDFLAGDGLTLADTTLVGVARWAEFHHVLDVAGYPRLAALRGRIEADPAVRFAQAVEDGETPPGSGACLGQVPLAEVLAEFAN